LNRRAFLTRNFAVAVFSGWQKSKVQWRRIRILNVSYSPAAARGAAASGSHRLALKIEELFAPATLREIPLSESPHV
jgi:hypothetical protein